jgi:hypothetical protein
MFSYSRRPETREIRRGRFALTLDRARRGMRFVLQMFYLSGKLFGIAPTGRTIAFTEMLANDPRRRQPGLKQLASVFAAST